MRGLFFYDQELDEHFGLPSAVSKTDCALVSCNDALKTFRVALQLAASVLKAKEYLR